MQPDKKLQDKAVFTGWIVFVSIFILLKLLFLAVMWSQGVGFGYLRQTIDDWAASVPRMIRSEILLIVAIVLSAYITAVMAKETRLQSILKLGFLLLITEAGIFFSAPLPATLPVWYVPVLLGSTFPAVLVGLLTDLLISKRLCSKRS